MHRTPRLTLPEDGNHGPVPRPRTPHQPSPGSTLETIINSLETKYRLGLSNRGETWSPSKKTNSGADKVYGKIKFCFFSFPGALDQILDKFESQAPHPTNPGERLQRLNKLLNEQIPSPRTGSQTPRGKPHTPLCSPLCKSNQLPQASHPSPLFQHAEPESEYVTAPQSGSATDEDEDDFETPPSPITESKAAQRRIQASPRVSSSSAMNKRPSDSSKDGESSPKFSRTSRGKQPHGQPLSPVDRRLHGSSSNGVFKKPSIELLRSFQSTAPSATTSFGFSQQSATQPDTANTSFASEAAGNDSTYQKLTRASPTTMGSLGDQELVAGSSKPVIEDQAQSIEATRQSSSYGSVDVDELVTTSMSCEEYETIRNPSARRMSGLFPTESFVYSEKTSSLHQSPVRLSHYIRDIPHQHLFVEDATEDLKRLPYFILFICLRITQENSISLQDLTRHIGSEYSDYENFWHSVKSHPESLNVRTRDPIKVWEAPKRKFERYTFKARVVFNNRRSGPVFNLELLPLLAEKPCRLQRAFGSDRFLYLTFPSFESGPSSQRFRGAEMIQIREQWKLWYMAEHSFLGRKWRAFHVEDSKVGRRKMSRRDDEDSYGKRVVLFATEGNDIERCSIGTMMNWFFPFAGDQNQKQSFCKAYARLDLALSKTEPTLVFEPAQVRYISDQVADGSPEDSRFNDPALVWEKCTEKPVMNDGCSQISVGAAHAIWKIYKKRNGINGPLPSTFQGRIGGAKGVWMISAESYTKDPDHLDIWIQINDSQLKFIPHADDWFFESYNQLRLTFELVNFSSPPTPSDLHISFIPIMVDRGVPIGVIAKLTESRLSFEREQLLEILSDPVRVYDWVHKQGGSGLRDVDTIRWQASLPQSLDEKVKFLLQSGFSPIESSYLSKCLLRFIERRQLQREKKLRIPLGKTTYLFGIADPLGVLSPGEVHVQFSATFTDESTDESYLRLDNMDVLAARQPACRRSDIQKVRAVVHSKLTHLVDVVVFPTRGQYPLAGKLQGGDYDGDMFWLCWDPALVVQFKNAPAPLKALESAKYGIKTDQRKLSQIMNVHEPSTVDNLLKEVLEFRTSRDLLGIVTNYLEKQAYAENRVYSGTLDSLCDIHDLLVDAPKQGYRFNEKEFREFTKRFGLPANPELPIYKAAMEKCEQGLEMGEVDSARNQQWLFNRNNVLDYLYFEVVRKHNNKTLNLVRDKLSNAQKNDEVLQYPYLWLREKHIPIIDQELDVLVRSIEGNFRQWNGRMHHDLTSNQYNDAVDECFKKFLAIMPTNIRDPEIQPWLEPYLYKDFTLWETIRASALYATYPYPEKAPFVFHMAGKQLAKLKADPLPGTRSVTLSILINMKPKPIRVPVQLEDSNSEDDFETANQDEV
ncbi:uncharacterized protein BDR25DRAFT_377566 [Lindgomyces ingoldianus]|uniref:Uncharacterized protein n=1 Tax=Lindgomyces ingoldianus TaxID=673940 RepID=A0ACB6QJW8_9PLEO|nr:uncharacterized protein BDR25DRAFT_377566 [Lindgomyces ingoldianus]KAF2466417.1 hypothetical protein BDR25DRAFT_377566 [Lindgomyces ingoldianus]